MPLYGYVLGWLTSGYDYLARLAFLKTLSPKNGIEKGLWSFIMASTNLAYGAVRAAGNTGALTYVFWMAIISYLLPTEFPVFLASTSFIHYMIYIATYYHQNMKEKIAYNAFKHTVMFYKTVAFIQMFWIYAQHATLDYISIVMIILGFGLSFSATLAIGINPTVPI